MVGRTPEDGLGASVSSRNQHRMPPFHSTCTHPRVSTHLGFAVWRASWALGFKTVLIGPFIPTGVPRGGRGGDNQPSF